MGPNDCEHTVDFNHSACKPRNRGNRCAFKDTHTLNANTVVVSTTLEGRNEVLASVEDEGVSWEDNGEVLGALTVVELLVVVVVGVVVVVAAAGFSLASAVPFGLIPVSMYPYVPVSSLPHFS